MDRNDRLAICQSQYSLYARWSTSREGNVEPYPAAPANRTVLLVPLSDKVHARRRAEWRSM